MSKYEEGFRQLENGEPFIEIYMKIGQDSIPLSLAYDNTAIFTHSEQYRHLDHVFVELEQVDDDSSEYQAIGAFIWRQVLPDWDDLKDALDKRDYRHFHAPYPSEMDVEQYEASKLEPPKSLFDRPKPEEPKEVKVIEEVEDDDVVTKAMEKIDHELAWFLNDPHFYKKHKRYDERYEDD
jgi:hypothetical protein